MEGKEYKIVSKVITYVYADNKEEARQCWENDEYVSYEEADIVSIEEI